MNPHSILAIVSVNIEISTRFYIDIYNCEKNKFFYNAYRPDVLGTCCIINIVFIVCVFRNSDKWEQRN